MAGLHFDSTFNGEPVMKALEKIQKGIYETAKAAELSGGRIDAAFNRISLKGLERIYELMQGFPKEVQGIESFKKEMADLEKRLEQANKKIIELQNQAKQPITIQTSTNEVTKEASAYDSLLASLNDILGARGQNVAAILREQNAIRLNQRELKVLEEIENKGLKLSDAQQTRRIQLTNSIMQHKQAISSLQQVINNEVKLEQVAFGSMEEMSQSLGRMRMAYRQLTEDGRNSKFGQDLLVGIQEADTKIKQLDATLGNHQREVGHYKQKWDGLGMSIQQIGREMPSLAYGPKIFFSAISNNLPILADELKRAKNEFNALKAEGKSATPVWKQIASSLFSWQSALTVGITLLTLYGDKVVDWVSGMFKANSAVKELLSAEQEMALSRSKVSESIKKESAELDILYSKLKSASISTKERTAAVNEWQKRYPEYANILNGENINLGKLESAYKALSKEIYANAVARSYADKIAELSVKKEKEEIKRLNQKLTVSRAEQKYNKQKENFDKQKEKGFGTATAKIEARDKVEKARKNVEEQKRIYNDLVNNVKNYDSNIATIENHIKTADLFPQPKEGTFDYWTQQKNIAEIALKSIASTQKELMDAGKFEGIPQEIINQYKQAAKLKAEADKALKIYDELTKQETQADKLRQEQEKYNLLLDKQKLDRQRQAEDLENQAAQAGIDAMSDGFDKVQAQREFNNKKELEALERQKEDYIRAIIQAEKEKFDANPENKGKSFDSSTVTVDTSKWDNIIKDTETKQGLNEWEQREASMNEYLLKYGTFSQKKEAIDKKYQDAINKETDLGVKNTLQKEWEEATANLDLSKLKQEINWEMIFGDLSKVTKEELTKIKAQLQEFKKSPDFQNATPEQIQVIEGALNSINNAMVDKGGFFGGMVDSITELRLATEELKTAEEELAKANKSGTEAQKEEAQKKVNQAKNKKQNAETNVTKSSDKTIGHLTAVGDAIAQLGSSAEMSLSSFGSAAGSIVDAFTEAGSKVGGMVGAIFSILEGIQKQGLDGFVGNILGGVAGAVGGVLDTITFGAFGLGGADYSGYDNMKSQYENLISIWDELIDKKMEYIDIDYGKEALKAAKEAEDATNMQINRRRQLIKQLASSGVSAGSHSLGYRIDHRLSKEDYQRLSDLTGEKITAEYQLWDLSSEQIEKILTDEKLVSVLDTVNKDFVTYLQNIADYGDKLEEIAEKEKAAITGMGFDEFRDGYVDLLSDLDSTNEDFADNFEKYLQKAIFQSLIANEYKDDIQNLYDSWAEAGKDGVYTDDEIKELRNKEKKISDRMLADRDALKDAMGWETEDSSREASAKGIATASQESVDENNGRLTVIQEHTFNLNENVTRIATGIDSIVNHTANLSCLTNIDKTMQSLLTMREQTITHLANIDNHTSNLVEMRNDMHSMKQDISTMLIKGLKLSKN